MTFSISRTKMYSKSEKFIYPWSEVELYGKKTESIVSNPTKLTFLLNNCNSDFKPVIANALSLAFLIDGKTETHEGYNAKMTKCYSEKSQNNNPKSAENNAMKFYFVVLILIFETNTIKMQ